MTNRRLLSLAFLVALALQANAASAQTPIFLLDTDEASYASVFRVRPATGQLTPVGSLPMNLGPIVALAAANDDVLYAVARGGAVLEIAVSPFAVRSLGNIGPNFIAGLAFGEDALYATDEVSGSLYRIDLAPLAVSLIGVVRFADGTPLGIGGGDLAQDAAGGWFLWTNSTQALYRLDAATAVVTPVPAQVTGLGFTNGLAFDYRAGGALLGSVGDLDVLRTLDPASGQPLSEVTFCLACPTPYNAVFGDLASPQAPCPQPKGYWRANRSAWPVTSLMLGSQTYGQASLLALLGMRINADASLNLAHQLIAAKLNVAAGSNPTPIAGTISNADALLAPFPGLLPYNVAPSSATGRLMLAVARILDDYNNAELTPTCTLP
jgi:hypothetical protein